MLIEAVIIRADGNDSETVRAKVDVRTMGYNEFQPQASDSPLRGKYLLGKPLRVSVISTGSGSDLSNLFRDAQLATQYVNLSESSDEDASDPENASYEVCHSNQVVRS